ncbi:MAG: ATP-binding cassette domain-containing protein [Deltaproteobacteria bacterium]|nr:ATP-binding cassette domain-containing protein [Deltaproteobacteria bacterium]
MKGKPLLEVIDLGKKFPIREGLLNRVKKHVHAVSQVSIKIYPNETLGLVGESGSGKSTLGRLIMQLIKADQGQIIFIDQKLNELSFRKARQFRKKMQMIFQDPLDSLNSRMTIEQIITEPLEINRIGNRLERREKAKDLLDTVGLRKNILDLYPHEFSGGQRQRIGIARALALSPSLIIADEPVSALDVSIQAQILNLMLNLQKDFGISYLFIAHDIHVIHFIADRVAVMYLGRIVEIADSKELKKTPKHPYTQALFNSIPYPDPIKKKKYQPIQGEIPSMINPPSGCAFHTRCPSVMERCRKELPKLRVLDQEERHEVACFLHD